ncbi:HdeD family acid-resistance protein [Phormidesmis priestleyi]
MKTETIADVRQNSGWLVGLGILMIVLGIAAIVEPFMATIAIARVLSWVFLFAGIIRTVHAVQTRSQGGFWLRLMVGILYIVTGIVLLGNLLGAALTLTLAFGWVILIQGVLEVIAAFKMRSEANWGWMLSGIVAIILGILILNQWPLGAAWMLGVYVGLSFLFAGITMIVLPLTIRHNYH